MADDTLLDVMSRSDALSLQERLRLAAYLLDRARQECASGERRRKWRELRGLTRYPLAGEDAQQWVSRTRREADADREQQCRTD